MQKSEWGSSKLPERWNRIAPYSKALIIQWLQHRHNDMPPCWGNMHYADRKAVILHLCAVGSVNAHDHPRVRAVAGLDAAAATQKCLQHRDVDTYTASSAMKALQTLSQCVNRFGYRDGGYVPKSQATMHGPLRSRHPARYDLTQGLGQPMLYPKSNDGKRILPSIYTTLRNKWLRASRLWQDPAAMNQGHLKNVRDLLNESHVNLVDRMTCLLGKMHGHLTNRPDLQAKLVDLYHDFEALQVDELYPIVEVIASHIQVPVDAEGFETDGLDWDGK